MKQNHRLLWHTLLAALSLFLLLATLGCQGSDPETATPRATLSATTAVPAPTNTPESAPPPVTGTAPPPQPSPTTPRPRTATPTPVPPTATPESPADFAALYETLADLDGSARVGDILEALAESEALCLQKELGGEDYTAVSGQPALDVATMALIASAPCIGPERASDIMVAVMAEAIGELPDETEGCIRDEVTDSHGTDSGSSLYGPSFMKCLDTEQFAELSASEIAVWAGGVGGDTRECLREVLSAGFGAAEGLGSGNPQHSMGITFTFHNAAIYGCLSDEQIAVFTGEDAAPSAPAIECLRYLYTQEFPRLYNDIGPRMFGDGLDLSPEQQDAIDAFLDSRAECATNSVAYPTPEGPGPTLRPRVQIGLPLVIDEDTTVKEIIVSFGQDGVACIRDELFGPAFSLQEAEKAYERFLAMPSVLLTRIPITLELCFSEKFAAEVNVAVIIASFGIEDADVEVCLLREFAELDSLSQGSLGFPIWPSGEPYFRCLTEESYQNLVIAQLAAYFGELPTHSESCIREIAGDGFNIARRTSNSEFHSDLSYLFEIAAHAVCLTEEQFNATYPPPPGDAVKLPPGYLDCIGSSYDTAVARLAVESDESAWADGESPALNALRDDIRGCKTHP